MKTILKIKRSDNPPLTYILEDGELAYNKTKKCFYVGDGITKLMHLKEYTNLVKGEDNRMYAVSVDRNGNASAKPCSQYMNKNYAYDLYAE